MAEYKTLSRRMWRHAKSLRYMTLEKWLNFTRLLRDMRRRRDVVSSRPAFARVNPCSVCNLACPGCQIYDDKRGIEPYQRPKGMMPLKTFHRIVDSLRESVVEMVLYDEGEPLLNRAIWDMVAYAAQSRIRTVISSNLSLRMNDQQVLALVESGLDYLIVGLDGVTQQTYERHRQGGSLELVRENLERILALKRRRAGCKLEVEAQFIEFPYNVHEKQQVVRYAKQIGVDSIRCFLPYSAELSDTSSLNGRHRRHFGCFDIYATADFDIDGSLYSCDFQEDSGSSRVGSINETDFGSLWNCHRMRDLRRGFRRDCSDELDRVCGTCPVTRGLPAVLV